MEHREKTASVHPWAKIIKDKYANKIKYAHNSIRNVVYPKPKKKVPNENRIKFTVIGNRVAKEFIYCVNLVRGMHKYRSKNFEAPVIREVTEVQWPNVLHEIRLQYGGASYCIPGQVAVIYNDKYLGGVEELKEMIESRYCYHLALNYEKESALQFIRYTYQRLYLDKTQQTDILSIVHYYSSGQQKRHCWTHVGMSAEAKPRQTYKPCAYLNISIGKRAIGTLIFMLYSDVCPVTCENFLQLCKDTKGGYNGTPVHRVVKDGWIQCGGYGLKNTPMSCENFIVPHDRRGVLGMCNADRHIDCSTQFFVLLQPAPWMKGRYVAFGQLIDGEQTLIKIESVPTYYESPLVDITIHKAGILNVDCRDLPINKGVNEYIQGHIEDLVTVGRIFYEMLMENVYLEIEFRKIAKLGSSTGEAEGESDEDTKDHMRATKRFIRNKEDIQKQLEKAREKQHSRTSKRSDRDDNENNDFDVEDYSYEPEEYSYSQVSPSVTTTSGRPKVPFYIPLTDVKYPGEVDSDFNLKRFLQGDYCLESDLDPKALTKKCTHKEEKPEDLKNTPILNKDVSQMIESYRSAESFGEEEEMEEESEMDSEEEKEITDYLQVYADQVSFDGRLVRRIASKYTHENPYLVDKVQFNDEEVRRMKMAKDDVNENKLKTIKTQQAPWETHKQIKRRQTGFAHGKQVKDEEIEEEAPKKQVESLNEEEESSASRLRKVSIFAPDDNDEDRANKMKRRPTGFIIAADLARVKASQQDDDDDDEEEEEKEGDEQPHKVRLVVKDKKNLTKTEDEEEAAKKTGPGSEVRSSVLQRLYEDTNLDEPIPTLKDYKSPAEKAPKRRFLFKESGIPGLNAGLNDKLDYFRPMTIHDESFEQVLNIQHGKKIQQNISSDYVNTMDHIQRRPETSLRAVEFARTRPSLTVSQYQLRNQLHAMENKKEDKDKEKEKEKKLNKAAAAGTTQSSA